MTETLYASILHLDRRAVKKLKITDPYSLHRVVYSLFEDTRSEKEKMISTASGIVYADQGGDFTSRRILLLSNRIPDATVNGDLGRVETKKIPQDFLGAKQYRFKTMVNPTYRANISRKLIPIKNRKAIGTWFCQRAPKSWGFDVCKENLQVERVEVLSFKGKKQHQITISRATIQGVLRVTDRARFIQSFSQGIGRGRAFGCGLLQLVPQQFNFFDEKRRV